MEYILERAKSNDFWVDIADVGSGKAKLYLLNGGTPPPRPALGDFAYDFNRKTMQVFYGDGWRTVTIQDIDSRLSHPTGNKAVVWLTDKGLPFWMPALAEDRLCNFRTVESILRCFSQQSDARKIQVSHRPSECYHPSLLIVS